MIVWYEQNCFFVLIYEELSSNDPQISHMIKNVLFKLINLIDKNSDIKIEMEQTERCRNDVYRLLADNMGKTFEVVEMLCDRNNWFTGSEAAEYGLIDTVIKKK